MGNFLSLILKFLFYRPEDGGNLGAKCLVIHIARTSHTQGTPVTGWIK